MLRKPRKYRLKQSTTHLSGDSNKPAGTIVYDCYKPTYGLVSEDSRNFGLEFISVTEDPTGDYPFFTCPENFLEEIKD